MPWDKKEILAEYARDITISNLAIESFENELRKNLEQKNEQAYYLNLIQDRWLDMTGVEGNLVHLRGQKNIKALTDRMSECITEAALREKFCADFEKDALTDKPARFFVTEIIREKIFLYYQKEIPYAVEVVVELFKEEAELIHIKALIIVERDSQKGIIIGHRGQALKKVGAMARKDIERFFDKKVFLEMFVKVEKDWRNRDNMLKNFGYQLD